MKIVLAGGKKVTYYLTKALISKGLNVSIINNDKIFCEELSRDLKALVIYGDASNLETLKKAEIFQNDIVVALTPRDADNLIISQLCKRILGVQKVFTMINDPENVEVLKKLGLENIFSITEILTSILEQRLSAHQISNIISFEDGKVLVLQLEVKEGFPVVGMQIKMLGLPRGSIVGTINRLGKVIVPHGDTILETGDRLLLMCLPNVQTETLKIISGIE